MSSISRFLPRIKKLPPSVRLRPGYTVVEEQPGQYLLHSGAYSFKITVPFPSISLLDFFESLSEDHTILETLETRSPLHINFFLDVLETLYDSKLLVPTLNGRHEVNPRYVSSANLFDQFQQRNPNNGVNTFFSERVWQERLTTVKVGLVGLGQIGSQLARLLTIAGVKQIVGIDDGFVDEAFRYTDAYFFDADQGGLRSEAVRHNLQNVNNETQFASVPFSLEKLKQGFLPSEFLEADLVIVATDQPSTQLYKGVNQACLDAGIPWTSYRPGWDGMTIEIGPTVLPKETACYECYQLRRQSNLADPEQDEALTQALEQKPLPLLSSQITPCISIFCYEILHLLSGEIQPKTLGAILKFDMMKAELVWHPLLKVPRCVACRRDIQTFMPTRFWSDIMPETEEVVMSHEATAVHVQEGLVT